MTALRLPAVAGRFYPSDPDALARLVRGLLGPLAPAAALGAIVPHAGYVYSGQVAGATFRRLAVPERVVLLGPNHTGRGAPISVMCAGAYRIPGADIPVDRDLAAVILNGLPGAEDDTIAHDQEHALEVELPFLAALQPGLRIVPIVLGGLDGPRAAAVGTALAALLPADVLVIASSDLSHYLPHDVAVARDRLAIDRLVALDPLGLAETCAREDISMCGVLPATALLAYARARGAKTAELIEYATSGAAFGAYDSVVGYAGVVIAAEPRRP